MLPSGSNTKSNRLVGERVRVTDHSRQHGSSPVSAVFGLAVFLGFFALATQLALHLYATTVVNAAAFDAARYASAEGRGCTSVAARASAEGIARSRLGAFGIRSDVSVICQEVDGVTHVTVAGRSPANAFASVGVTRRDWTISRTVHIESERAP